VRRRASPARTLAFETLRDVEERGAHADASLGARLARSTLGAADQALATRLVYGTLAWQGRLDWHVAQVSTTPPERLDPWLRVILRLGLYQLLFLDRIPDHAAVDTSVELARRFRRGAATGLVNAALRRAASATPALPLADGSDPAHAQAIRWSHPAWLVARWRRELGAADTEALLRADQEAAPTVLRVHTLATQREAVLEALRAAGIPGASTRYAPDGVVLDAPLAAIRDVVPHRWYTLQGEASQLVGHLVAPQPGERILDACAAPGGKATHLAALMHDRGDLLAVDTSEVGLEAVRERSADLGLTIVRTRQADSRRLAAGLSGLDATPSFDRILVDAPCSGLGTLRGHPELRWRIHEADIAELAGRQLQILESAGSLCRPGGIVVYATCTLTDDENGAVVARFLESYPEFARDDPKRVLPEAAHGLVDAQGCLRTLPHRHDLDGFFAVRLRRRPA
jgi:16S rRNA (cytosine967-C5)-methyltransferase